MSPMETEICVSSTFFQKQKQKDVFVRFLDLYTTYIKRFTI